jgi:drug/metabolite transporter (DMT)-like permease
MPASMTLQHSKAATIAFIYLGTCFYVLAAYLHLSLGDKWTFFKAFAIALPLVMIEYQFSLRGNHAAFAHHHFSAVQILLFTLVFYFVNTWILDAVILRSRREPSWWWKDVACFLLIAAAFYLNSRRSSSSS